MLVKRKSAFSRSSWSKGVGLFGPKGLVYLIIVFFVCLVIMNRGRVGRDGLVG